MKVLEELRQLQEKLDYYKLAKQVASGEEVAAADILEACRLAGKETSSFGQLVATIEQRQELREKYTTLGTIKEQVKKLEAEVERENEKLEAAVEAHRAATAPLQDQLEATRRELHQVEGIPTDLVRRCPHEGLLHQFNVVNGNRHNADFQATYNGPSEMELRQACEDY